MVLSAELSKLKQLSADFFHSAHHKIIAADFRNMADKRPFSLYDRRPFSAICLLFRSLDSPFRQHIWGISFSFMVSSTRKHNIN